MNTTYMILFVLMLPACLIAMAFASKQLYALIWNFSWFLIFAKVGLLAFDSPWGAFPALVFAIQYAMRAMRPGVRPTINMQYWTQQYASKKDASPEESPAKEGEIIEAEFRHADNDSKRIP